MDTQISARPRVRTLADIIAFEHIPLEQRALPQSTYAMLCQAAAITPGRTALYYFADADRYDEGIHISYAQLIARIHQTANLLSDLGIGPHDVISLLLPNTPQAQYVLWGAEASGIVNPVNFFLEPSQMVSILRAAGTKVLAASGPTPGFDIWEKVQFIRERVPSIEKVIQVGGKPGSDSHVINFEQVIDSYSSERLSSGRNIASSEIAAFFHTGGTTGSPKLAQQTHGNEVYTAWALGVATDVAAQAVRVNGLPLFHVHSAIANSLAPLSRGASVVLPTPAGYRNPAVIRNFWHIIEHYQVTAFSSVPTMLVSLLQVPIANADISSLSFVGSGTAPLSGQTHSAFEQHVGIQIIEGWGLTEATSVSTANPKYGELRIGSIGLRIPYQQIKIVHLDTDGNYVRDCLAGEAGAIVVKGPSVFPGYLDETQNANLWLQDGWLNTGDLGWQDDDGYIWLTGRAKDVIIRGGNNIDPRIIEEALYKHPSLVNCWQVWYYFSRKARNFCS